MHESAIAMGIVREVEKHVSIMGRGVTVKVILGELQNVDEEVLDEFIKIFLEEHGLRDVRYRFVRERASFRCSSCGHEWHLEDLSLSDVERESVHFLPEAVYAVVKCPRCNSRIFDIVSGRGVKIAFEGGERAD